MLIGLAVTIPKNILGMTIVYQDLSVKDVSAVKLEKQTLQIAGITIAVLLILGFVYGFRRFWRGTGSLC